MHMQQAHLAMPMGWGLTLRGDAVFRLQLLEERKDFVAKQGLNLPRLNPNELLPKVEEIVVAT